MIRREDGDTWLLIAQGDHAHLAARLASAWGRAPIEPLPLREVLLPAIRDHDEGWWRWEQRPQVDPSTRHPRDFTEMPMPVATAIWTESIDICAAGVASHRTAIERLQTIEGLSVHELPPLESAVLEAVLSFRHSLSPEEIAEAAARRLGVEVDANRIGEFVRTLLRCEILRPLPSLLSPERYELALPLEGASPLGAIWVSRHFRFLAEKARERRFDPAELEALRTFLDEQSERETHWIEEAAHQFADEDIEPLLQLGFRYVQSFDRISLWLACAERNRVWETSLPGTGRLRFEPLGPNRVTIAPWPLATDRLVLQLPARRIPAGRYADDEALWTALHQGEQVQLVWTFEPDKHD